MVLYTNLSSQQALSGDFPVRLLNMARVGVNKRRISG
jgi:hypothetical protein